MTQNKKYSIAVSKEKSRWKAEIIRRASAKNNVVSKTQAGFKTKKEAIAWAEEQLALFTTTQSEQNKRRSEKRK
ncbi:MAG: pressure-regulated protein [Cycloclasticus sp. symbiont of Bathymodiolus heckerae]|nr:MAG: pressure-regulated protein [Cycloclasticus sp. symbiont of Bathymodiolus heckerae]